MPEKNRLVIYHANCVDGFTAAWCAWKKYGDEAEYLAANYGDEPPDVLGRDVLIVDFSYPRRRLQYMASDANSIQVFDHHKTAQAELEGLDFCVFDMARSGAGIAFDELHGDREHEGALISGAELVNYVEDRDLWRWALLDSREINQWIGSWERTFDRWTDLACVLDDDFEAPSDEGKAILRALDGYVEGLSKKFMTVTIGGHSVPCINTTHAVSELVGKLAEREGVPFAAGWFQRNDGKFVYSLRSRGDFDVSEVAKQYGGGGHRNAAGFTTEELIHG